MGRDKLYYVYILLCNDLTYYTGITTNLNRRIKEHNLGLGAKYTKNRRPIKLIESFIVKGRSNATKEEIKIKKLKKEEKIKYFKNKNNEKNLE